MNIDHKAAAELRLAQARDWDGEGIVSVDSALRAAQVHATIALVEAVTTQTAIDEQIAHAIQRDSKKQDRRT